MGTPTMRYLHYVPQDDAAKLTAAITDQIPSAVAVDTVSVTQVGFPGSTA